MFKKFGVALAASFIFANSAFALFGIGIGGHMAYDPFAKIEGNSSTISETPSATFTQYEAEQIHGAGLKIWVHTLPIVNVEATVNFMGTRYGAGINVAGTPQNLEVETGMPFFEKASPVYGFTSVDLTVTYPFFELLWLQLQAGGGYTQFLSTKIINQEFMESVIAESLSDPNNFNSADLAEATASKIKDEGLHSGAGIHLMAGAYFSPPIIPVAVYANAKYYLGGDMADDVSKGLTLEIGGGLAF